MAATESQNWSNFCLKTIFRVYFDQLVTINLFTTSESPKIRIPIVQIFCFDFFNDSETNNLR